LAIVYALEKFRIYVYGHKIVLHTDNKSLTFLDKCAITSNRVARWLIAIQEYDIEIKHIKGTDNYLADILSRNPAGLITTEIQKLSKPNSIFVNKINLGVDSSVCKDLKRLSDLQSTDPRIEGIREKLAARLYKRDLQHRLEGNLLFRRGNQDSTVWKPMLPECLEMPVIKYVHETLGYSGVDKCTYEINQAYHLKNIGRKVRKFTASCDICQRVKHPNRSVDTEERSHLPMKPGDLCAIDIYGSLPTGRGGVRYILVCFHVFSKYIKLYSLKTATTKSCFNRLVNNYFAEVVKPKIILSDNGTKFQSPLWKRTLQAHDVKCRFSAVRHPQSNPRERCMREISKFCRFYCYQNHKKWAELVPRIEYWLNYTVASTTLYAPVELMFGSKKPNVFERLMPKLPEGEQGQEELNQKLTKAYERLKQKSNKRKRRKKHGNSGWKPAVNDRVLAKTEPISNATMGITAKFVRSFTGLYIVRKLIPPSTYELADDQGKVRGQFNLKSLKAYKQATDCT
jgi:hypothetical protein